MESGTFPKKATHYPSTHPGMMAVSFLLFSAVLAYLFHCYDDGSIQPWQPYFAYSTLWIGAGIYIVKWTRAVYFTSEGLIFCQFGWVYRTMNWDEIIQIGVAKEYKASKLTIAITPDTCPKFDTSCPTPTIYVERYRWRLILLDATEENLQSIRTLYGELDYHTNRTSF